MQHVHTSTLSFTHLTRARNSNPNLTRASKHTYTFAYTYTSHAHTYHIHTRIYIPMKIHIHTYIHIHTDVYTYTGLQWLHRQGRGLQSCKSSLLRPGHGYGGNIEGRFTTWELPFIAWCDRQASLIAVTLTHTQSHSLSYPQGCAAGILHQQRRA